MTAAVSEARTLAMVIVGPGLASGRVALTPALLEELRLALEVGELLDQVGWTTEPRPGYVPGTPAYRCTVGPVRVFVLVESSS